MTPIPVEQALTLLLQAIHPIEAVERLPLGLACGRIFAHTVLARLPQPPFNRSAMDGYALCSTDLTEELTLSLQSPTEALLPGHAMPITTWRADAGRRGLHDPAGSRYGNCWQGTATLCSKGRAECDASAAVSGCRYLPAGSW